MRDPKTITADSKIEVQMPDGTIRLASTRPVPEEWDFIAMLGYTHWPHIDGYEISQSDAGNFRAKPDHYIEVFSDYHTPTIKYARVGKEWFSFPALRDGWSKRQPWHPSPAVAENMSRIENMTTFSGLPWLAEEVLGIPKERVAVCRADDYEALLMGEPA